jgi:23S rRNA (cytosine1962-C5)-methyltransferase
VEPTWVRNRLQEGTNSFRLTSSPLAWLECFGNDLLLSWKTDSAREALLQECQTRLINPNGPYALELKPPARIFGRHLARAAQERLAPVLLTGDCQLPLETEVQEAGTRYGIDFSAGYSVGLFLDQRGNRASLAQALTARTSPAKMLNTFAYTCSFSVVAARFGAQTLSVDLSKKSLQRGEQNFRRNKIEPKEGHRFIADDVFGVLPRLAKRGEKFDFIVLDPPTFSRNHEGTPFQAEEDYGRLVELALELAAPGAQILLSTNCTTLRSVDLEQIARHALKRARLSGRFWANPTPSDIPAAQAAQTVWLQL